MFVTCQNLRKASMLESVRVFNFTFKISSSVQVVFTCSKLTIETLEQGFIAQRRSFTKHVRSKKESV